MKKSLRILRQELESNSRLGQGVTTQVVIPWMLEAFERMEKERKDPRVKVKAKEERTTMDMAKAVEEKEIRTLPKAIATSVVSLAIGPMNAGTTPKEARNRKQVERR